MFQMYLLLEDADGEQIYVSVHDGVSCIIYYYQSSLGPLIPSTNSHPSSMASNAATLTKTQQLIGRYQTVFLPY